MAQRKVTRKKSASKGPSRPAKQTRVHRDALISGEANDVAIESKDASKGGKPKVHAKVVSIIVSIGTEDRKRSHEDFVKDIEKRLGVVPRTDGNGNRKPGIHATVTGGYYILDGKVCLPDDYDKKTGTFKDGSTPPSWAGGPKHNPNVGAGSQIQYDLEHLSRDEYDKKYGLGKYHREETGKGIITPERQKELTAQWRAEKQAREEADLEEIDDFEWDESDVEDTSKLSAAADKSAKAAVRRIKKSASPKKRVVKKPTPKPQKKTVRRNKK